MAMHTELNNTMPTEISWSKSLIYAILAVGVGFGILHIFLRDRTPDAFRFTLKGHNGQVLCLAFAPDGKKLVSGSADCQIRVWDLSRQELLFVLSGHTKSVVALAFSPDGKYLVSGSLDGSIRRWDIENSQSPPQLIGNVNEDKRGTPLPVYCLAFTPDGKLLVSGGADKVARLWSNATRTSVGALHHLHPVRSIAISTDGRVVITRAENGEVSTWDLQRQQRIRKLEHGSLIRKTHCLLVGARDNRVAINGTVTEKIKQWDVSTGESLPTLKAELSMQDSPIRVMALSPNEAVIVGIPLRGADMIFWEPAQGKHLGMVNFPANTDALAFSPDSATLASAHSNGEIHLWNFSKLSPAR